MKSDKKNIFSIIIGIATVVISLVGITFAYFTTKMTGTNGLVNITSGTVGKITFDGGADFTTADEIDTLPWEESKTFTITVGPSSVKQTVYVWMDYVNTIPELTANVKDSVNGAAGDLVLGTTGASKDAPGNTRTIKLVQKTFEPSTTTQTITYTLTMGIPETGENQKENLNQIFDATLYANLGEENRTYYYNNANPNGVLNPPSAE